MYVFNDTNLLSQEEISFYKQEILDLYSKNPSDLWDSRSIVLKNDVLINKIKNFLEPRTNCVLTCSSAQIQLWPVGSRSKLHIHDDYGRQNGDFNSMLYLNKDFDGGEFITDFGLSLKPQPNMLTFFNGRNIYHGVNEVCGNHRYTIIFWWENTKFNLL